MPHAEPIRIRVHIRKGDQVRIISGADKDAFKNKTGRVLSVNAYKGVLTVEHAHMFKRHTKANPSKNIKGGIVEREGPIHISNVALVCPACSKTTRVAHKLVKAENGKMKSVRACHRCHAEL